MRCSSTFVDGLARILATVQERLEHGPGLAVIRGLPLDADGRSGVPSGD